MPLLGFVSPFQVQGFQISVSKLTLRPQQDELRWEEVPEQHDLEMGALASAGREKDGFPRRSWEP